MPFFIVYDLLSYYFIQGVLRTLLQMRVWCIIELLVRQIGKNNELVLAYCKFLSSYIWEAWKMSVWPDEFQTQILKHDSLSTKQEYVLLSNNICLSVWHFIISRTCKTLWHSRGMLYIRIENDLKYFGP